jgi:hypothetical protein
MTTSTPNNSAATAALSDAEDAKEVEAPKTILRKVFKTR